MNAKSALQIKDFRACYNGDDAADPHGFSQPWNNAGIDRNSVDPNKGYTYGFRLIRVLIRVLITVFG